MSASNSLQIHFLRNPSTAYSAKHDDEVSTLLHVGWPKG